MYKVLDRSRSIVAWCKVSGSRGQILDRSLRGIGWVEADGQVLDPSFNRVGWITDDGQILDRSLRGIGWIEDDGSVLDRSSRCIGWAEVNEPWALMGAAASLLLLR